MAELQAKQALLKGVRDAEGQAALAPQLQDAITAAANVAAAGGDAHAAADAVKDAAGQALALSPKRFKPCLHSLCVGRFRRFELSCKPGEC